MITLKPDLNPQVLIQGMTGKEGQRALRFMQAAGTEVVAGVTPGKGGQEVDGIPVYDTVEAALAEHPDISISCAYVPPKFAPDAVEESILAGIELVHVFAEGLPTLETAQLLELAERHNARILGPSSVGLMRPGRYSLGTIGGGDMDAYLPATETEPGIAILSKSGGMAHTVADMMTRSGVPQSLVVGIGGDRFVGSTFADLLDDIEDDPTTRAIMLVGEIGGSYEEDFAREIEKRGIDIPIYAFIAGKFAETLPTGVAFGHAGAIVSEKQGSRAHKVGALQSVGATIVDDIREAIRGL